jgi:hypothetical protein
LGIVLTAGQASECQTGPDVLNAVCLPRARGTSSSAPLGPGRGQRVQRRLVSGVFEGTSH